MLENQLSRYGAISRVVPDLAPGAKLFLVSDSDDTTVGPANLGNEYPVDKDGVVRVYTTIQAAVNAASAGRGDVVGVLPGYDHTLGRADSWATAGVRVVGFGNGSNRPIVRYTTATDEVGVGANNIEIRNIRFLAAVDSCARALDLDSGFSGAAIRNCIFDFAATGNDFRVMLRNSQARSVIEDNEFRAEDTAGAGKGVSFNGGYADFTVVRNNRFFGQFDTVGDTSNAAGAITVDIAHDSGDTVLNGVLIENNTIISTDTAAALLINLGNGATSSRGSAMIRNNLVSYDTATADTAQISTGATHYFGALDNKFKSTDSDVRESVVSTVVSRIFDSG